MADFVRRFIDSPPFAWQTALLPELLESDEPLDSVPENVAILVAMARDLASLYWDKSRFGGLPSEGEMVAHYVVPLLRAHGWPPELIAVEWRNTDAAVFDRLPREPENCRFVIEAKRLDTGAESALEQAKAYVASLGAACDVIVTDGIRYRLYGHENDFNEVAYANLSRLKRRAMEFFEKISKT